MFSHFLRKLATLGSRPDVSAVRGGGLVWHPLPAAGELVPFLPNLFAHPTATVVKQNHQRTILRLELPGGAVFVKRSRANTPRAWAREILRPPKARLEFENALRLRAAGIPCAEPLAWAEADSLWPGECAIVTRECGDATPLDTFLTDTAPTLPLAVRRQVAASLGRLFAEMHSAGVAHPDPHPGNLLVRNGPNGPEFVLLDVHAVRFGPPLAWSEAKANLVLFNRWFQIRATRADRARFWAGYHATGRIRGMWTEDNRPQLACEVEVATADSNRRFWCARDDRYLGNNRQFRRVKAGDVRGHVVRDLPQVLVNELLADPDAQFSAAGSALLKDSPSSTVVVRGQLLFKRFRLKGRFDRIKNVFRRSEALRSWVFGHALLDRHLPTARPLFVAHRRRSGLPGVGYVVFERIPEAVELPAAVATMAFSELREMADRLGRLVRTLHDRGVSHRDLKPPNILLSGPDRQPVLIDLVGMAVGADVSDRIRRRDLTRLNAGFVRSELISHTIRLRFLRAYLTAWPARHGWKPWWRAIATATAAKVLRNARVGRPLA